MRPRAGGGSPSRHHGVMTTEMTDTTPVVTASSVPTKVASTRGAMAHRAAVDRLVASYRPIPAGSGVRLAKRTSTLFRPRAAAAGPGLDVSGLTGVVALDAVA